jgi:uncharacterized damage-inducible protein DinB
VAQAFDKAEEMSRLREGRGKLLAAVDGLSEEDLTQAPMAGDWTARDLLAHMLAWDEAAVQRLGLLSKGRGSEIDWISEDEVDTLNAKMHREKAGLSLDAVRAQVENVWLRIAEEVKGLPSSFDEGAVSLAVWFPNCTYKHYQEHVEQIAAWRRERETTEV